VTVDGARQPHTRKRLAHLHRCAHILDANERAAGQELEPHVVERVLDDLVRLGLYPERHERDLVHLSLEPCLIVIPPAASGSLVLGGVIVGVEPRRVVLDSKHRLPFERFASDEGVSAGLELEPQKVGGRDELRFAGESQQRIYVVRRGRLLCLRFASRIPRARATGVTPALPFDPAPLVLLALWLAQRHAIEAYRAAHEHAVADVPRVLTLEAVEARAGGSPQLGAFPLVQHVLLQLAPVLVAPGEHLRHEGVEVAGAVLLGARGLCRWRPVPLLLCGRADDGQADWDCEKSGAQTDAQVSHGGRTRRGRAGNPVHRRRRPPVPCSVRARE
jgi:hypothetical protein